jgi:hypothetical protein
VYLHFNRAEYTENMAKEIVLLHECCVVPYRITTSGVEFCLVTPCAENRWEFPKVRLADPAGCDAAAWQQAAESAGLHGAATSEEPLGSFEASRQNETRTMIGFLMRVDEVEDSWALQGSHRRLWCLPEEARLRIRRKPLRRFIDLALQQMKQATQA